MAQIYFGIDNLSVPVGETFEVGVFLDSHSQSIAAVESMLTLTKGLKFIDIRDGNSVINLWLDRPYGSDTEVFFSGLIPGGYAGQDGQLFTLVLQAQELGEMRIESHQSRTLLNDGQGTPAEVVAAPIGVTVVSEGVAVNYEAPTDDAPPEDFLPMLVGEDQLGQWSVVFAAQDKVSGIDYFEVKEGLFGWERANSPYALTDQKLHSRIYVKAVDRAGNERIATLSPANPLSWYGSFVFWSILAGVLVLMGAAAVIHRLWRQRTKRVGRK